MRKLIIVLFCLISLVTKAQVYQEMPQYGYRANRMAFDSTLQIPTTCGVPTLKSNVIKKAAIAFDSCNNKIYRYNPKTLTWSEISGSGSTPNLQQVTDVKDTTTHIIWLKQSDYYNGGLRIGNFINDTVPLLKMTAFELNNKYWSYLNFGKKDKPNLLTMQDYTESDMFYFRRQPKQGSALAYNSIEIAQSITTDSIYNMLECGLYVNLDSANSYVQLPYKTNSVKLKSGKQTSDNSLYLPNANGKTLVSSINNISADSTGNVIVTATDTTKVPYTGATGDVDLGNFQLNAKAVKINGTAGNGHIDLKHQSADATATGSSTALFANSNGDLKWKNDNKYYTTLTTNQTADRVYSFQNKTYTLADSADVAAKVNYSDTSSTIATKTNLTTKLNTSDSTIYYSKYRSDTSRSNIYSAINAKGSGTVTSVAALTLGTSGTDLTSTVATGTTTPVITLNVPTASATNRGALSSADWSTFNSKGYALNLGATQFSYLANTTYYFGMPITTPSTTAAIRRVYIPQSGTIKGGQIYMRTTAATSTENWTLSIRLNNSSNTTFATLGNNSTDKVFATSSLSISVAAGDYIEIITTTPGWTTAPGNTFTYGSIFIQ